MEVIAAVLAHAQAGSLRSTKPLLLSSIPLLQISCAQVTNEKSKVQSVTNNFIYNI
jgi:hypothetical protein